MYDVVVVGCGLAGITVARTLADKGFKVLIIERRNHIGGNLYDYVDEDKFLVQKYGPHCFFTDDINVKNYIEKYIDVEDCFVKCKTMINNQAIPMPFNFESIDIIYNETEAEELKSRLKTYFPNSEIVSVTDLLESKDELIKSYGQFMYENEYKLYTSKQWGLDISEISPAVFHRVPVYLSYKSDYQASKYQFLPVGGFTKMVENIISNDNITIKFNTDVLNDGVIKIKENKVCYVQDNIEYCDIPILFTGEVDALFDFKYGRLPYRSLEFVWKYHDLDSFQDTAIVAYPQADKITRVTEYKKLPNQKNKGTKISIEIPVPYEPVNSPIGNEPYYPIKNESNDDIYKRYSKDAEKLENLFLCGRLAEYKYYNMDDVIRRAQSIAEAIEKEICKR